ncbi:MAG TPA: hypothetical protein VMT76_01610 [Puia sp.]|nr:hypothetical protein [Puia sp.]
MNNSRQVYTFSFLFVIAVCKNLSAQVPVREEPHHKVVLENDYVRLIDVHIPAHDTTLAHIHAAPSAIVFLSKTIIGTQIVGAQPVIANVTPGQTSYAAYHEKPITHRVWNQGSSLFHVMDIELVRKIPGNDTGKIIWPASMQLQWQQKLVTTYKIALKKENRLVIPKSASAYLLIDITGAIKVNSGGNMHKLKSGEFVFASPRNEIDLAANNAGAECVLLELK